MLSVARPIPDSRKGDREIGPCYKITVLAEGHRNTIMTNGAIVDGGKRPWRGQGGADGRCEKNGERTG